MQTPFSVKEIFIMLQMAKIPISGESDFRRVVGGEGLELGIENSRHSCDASDASHASNAIDASDAKTRWLIDRWTH